MLTLNGKSNAGMLILGVIIFGAIVGLVFSLPVMLLWNGCLVPAITGVNEITWLQAWGLMILVNIFFKLSVSTKD
jgi:hypothetical protein